MLICDAFSGNFAWRQGENLRREAWAAENFATLPQKPAGGWSAHGQPCDGFHHLYRRLCNHYADAVLGYHEPGVRRADQPITLGIWDVWAEGFANQSPGQCKVLGLGLAANGQVPQNTLLGMDVTRTRD